MKILVTGASGYVGGRLIPVLLRRGHDVRATFSRLDEAGEFWWSDRVESVEMDVLDAGEVEAATRGIDAVAYLIHGMGGGDDFARKDRRGAQHMAAVAEATGVRRLVYLSGLVPDVREKKLSEHIASRLEVERILMDSGVPTISLRAAILLGSGSTSFEIVRQISERLPVRTIPAWMDNDVQPIAVVDALEVLVEALESDRPSRTYDIGGSERLPYRELLDRYARISGLARPEIIVPFGLPEALVSRLAALFTDVPSPTVEALVESLEHDMVCGECDFRDELLPTGYRMIGIDEAITRALARPPQDADPAGLDPLGPLPGDPAWAGGRIDLVGGRPRRDEDGLVGSVLLGPDLSAANATTAARDKDRS